MILISYDLYEIDIEKKEADCVVRILKVLLHVIVYSLYIDIDIEEDKSDLISVIRFVHNLSVVDNTRLDTVDQVDDG